ncbi:hypothetical protein ACFL7M_05260 [Thermodesulfobacteriota bacterium]
MESGIHKLKGLLNKIELRPCQGDADLKQKDEEIKMLKRAIYDLEKETNLFEIFTARGESIRI